MTNHLQPDGPAVSDVDTVAQIQSITQGSNAAVPASCARTITPACLQALYNMIGLTPQATDVSSIGVARYLGEFASDADLQISIFNLHYDKDMSDASVLDLLQEVPSCCSNTGTTIDR